MVGFYRGFRNYYLNGPAFAIGAGAWKATLELHLLRRYGRKQAWGFPGNPKRLNDKQE
jgi:hypothetical protein